MSLGSCIFDDISCMLLCCQQRCLNPTGHLYFLAHIRHILVLLVAHACIGNPLSIIVKHMLQKTEKGVAELGIMMNEVAGKLFKLLNIIEVL